MPLQFEIIEKEGELSIKSTFNPYSITRFKQRGGEWEPARKVWTWKNGGRENGLHVIRDLYGLSTSETVTVRIPASDCTEVEYNMAAYLVYRGYVLAVRGGRDASVRPMESLCSGFFPRSAGSSKHPAVSPSADAVFELEVCLDFAREYNLLPETAASQDADARRQELEASITRLKTELEAAEVELASL